MEHLYRNLSYKIMIMILTKNVYKNLSYKIVIMI
jgi:hypothetical protein